jgi:hypothetical protein
MMTDVHTKSLLSLLITSGSESRPALKSVPLGQQLWSAKEPQETMAKIGLPRLRARANA